MGMTFADLCARAETPAQAWEILLTEGHLPEEALDSPARRFECGLCFGRGNGVLRSEPVFRPAAIDYYDAPFERPCPRCQGAATFAIPDSLEAVWAFVRNYPRYLAVEALVHAAQHELRARGLKVPSVPVAYNPMSSVAYRYFHRGTVSLAFDAVGVLLPCYAEQNEARTGLMESARLDAQRCHTVTADGRHLVQGPLDGVWEEREPVASWQALHTYPEVCWWEIWHGKAVLLWRV